MMWKPEVLGVSYIAGLAYLAVKSDQEFNRDTPECLGWSILFGDNVRTIVGVERRMINAPIHIGEVLGLLLVE